MDKFHCEPKSWDDIFEFIDYIDTDSKVNQFISDIGKDGK